MVCGQDRGICRACTVAKGVSAAVVNHGSIEGRLSHGQRSPFKLSLAKRKRGMLITSPRKEQDLREYRILCRPGSSLWSKSRRPLCLVCSLSEMLPVKFGHKNQSTSRWYASKTFVKLCIIFCSLKKCVVGAQGVMTVGWNSRSHCGANDDSRGWHVCENNLILSSQCSRLFVWLLKVTG